MNLRLMAGFLLFSVLSFSQEESRSNPVDYDRLTDKMIELEIDVDVQSPSTLMLLLRKLSCPVLLLYTFYQKCRSTVSQFTSCRNCKKDTSETQSE